MVHSFRGEPSAFRKSKSDGLSGRALSNGALDSVIRYVEWTKSPDDRGGWALGHVGPIPEGMVAWLLAGAVLVGTCLLIGRRFGG